MEILIYLTFIFVLQLNAYGVLAIRISQKKCDDYRKKYPLSAEEFNDNDEEAAPNEFPFMAIIQRDQYSGNGILISENFVLSTATRPTVSIKPYVILGDLDKGTSNDNARLQRFDIIDEFIHTEFIEYNLSSNIKLIKLNGSVNVRPVCLSQPESENLQQILQIGWGYTNIRSNTRLHKLQLNYIPDRNCSESYTSVGYQKFVRDIASGQTLCAGVKKGDREMCVGYGGSALLNKRHDSMDEVIGIASFQFACNGSYPKLFVRVSSYIDWIESIVWPNETALMSQTTRKITTEASTAPEIESKTEEPRTPTVEITTEASTAPEIESKTEEPRTPTVEITTEASTTPEIESETEDVEPSTHKVEIANGTKVVELKFVIIIVAVLLLMLCVLVACLCLQCNKSRNLQNIALNVQYTSRD